ncbi:MAG: ABC transporter, partial [Arcobacter sp.]|nr:ABC transporter [Arcobacter sp.]
VITKASKGNLEVELSKGQLEYILKELKSYINPKLGGFAIILGSFFVLSLDNGYDNYAIGLFLLGIARVFYK